MVSEKGNTIYTYSERQVAHRNRKKAERLEKLEKSIHKLRAQVKKDLQSGDPDRLLTALAVALIDETYERVGNEESAEEGHFGVTGWTKDHVSFGKGKATISYVGKAGVKHKKTVADKLALKALKDAYEGCKDSLLSYEGGRVTASKVNAYLKQFDVTAKDLRGYHANLEMRERLQEARKGKLPEDPKERKAQLKDEFKEALEATAKAVGHEAATLKNQYLVPGLEDQFLKDGTVMDRMKAASSVAARFITGGFIPNKLFREKKAILRNLLDHPVKDPLDVSVGIEDLKGFFDVLLRDLESLGLHDWASESMARRTQDLKDRLEGVGVAARELHRSLDSTPLPTQNVEQDIKWALQIEILGLFEVKVPTLGHAVRATWKVDARLVDGAVARVLRKATPEFLEALDTLRKNELDDQANRVKFAFFQKVRLEEVAKGIVGVSKTTWDPLKWVDFLQETLESNFTQEKLQAFTEFDLYGMKVVVDDKTLGAYDVEKYVKYLDVAYQKMKQKGVASAWYGKVFIQCQGCGGVNRNNGGGVGGHYVIGKDTVAIFERPSSFIVELMAHELGHRYWFKQMTQSQRGKFESIVRVRTKGQKPVPGELRLISDEKVAEAKDLVRAVGQKALNAVNEFKSAILRAKKHRQAIEREYPALAQAGWALAGDIWSALQSSGADTLLNPEVKSLYTSCLEAAEAARKVMYDADETIKRRMMAVPDPTTPIDNVDRYWMGVLKQVLPGWYREVSDIIAEAINAGHRFINKAVADYNEAEKDRPAKRLKEWEDAWENDPREVMPVSDYGKSNIDEAFAEAFAHYVMGEDMTRDQIESFKAVLNDGRRTADMQRLDLAWVEKLRRDFLALLKNIPRVKDYRTAHELRAAIRVYVNRFDDLFFENFLNRDVKYNMGLSDGDVAWVQKELRSAAWDFSRTLDSMPIGFADQYVSEGEYFARFERDAEAWKAKSQRKAQDFWKKVKYIIEWFERVHQKPLVVKTPNIDKTTIEGFTLVMKGFEEGDEYHAEYLEVFKAGLHHYRMRASKVAPLLLQKQVPIIVDFKTSLDQGGEYTNQTIIFYASSTNQGPKWVAHALAHEMGHHLFKTYLNSDQRNVWYQTIKGDFGDLDLGELLRSWPGNAWGFDFVKHVDDPILGLQVEALTHDPDFKDLQTKEDFQALYDKGTRTLKVPKTPITGYANKNPEEAFCETIGLLVAYGPMAVHPRVRQWLETSLPGGIRTASVAGRVLARFLCR